MLGYLGLGRNARSGWRSRRRSVVSLTVAIATVTAMSACGGGDVDPGGGGEDRAVVVGFTPLSTGDILMSMAADKGLPEQKGVKLTNERVSTVAVLYQDFTAGRYDCIFTDPAVFVEQASQGLPVTIIAATSPNFSYLIARKDSGIDDPGDLVGKRLVAATATGGYRVFRAAALKWYGVDLEEQVEVIQAATDSEGLAQIVAGSADAMFTFETFVTRALLSDDSVDVVYRPAIDYKDRTGETLWQNVILCRTDRGLTSDQSEKFAEVLADVAADISADPDAADKYAVDNLGADPGIYAESFKSGRLEFDVQPLNDAVVAEIVGMIEFQQEAGTMADFEIPASYLNGIS